MDYRVEITFDAEIEVEAIVSYIATDAPGREIAWIDRFHQLAASLGRHPQRCGMAPEDRLVDFQVRQLMFGNYRILFTVQEAIVYILHVRHGARRPLPVDELKQP